MSKERLKEIIKRMDILKKSGRSTEFDLAAVEFVLDHGEYLVEQAERVEELEEQNIKYRTFKNYDNLETLANFSNEIRRLTEQNKRYRELLEEVIDEGSCLMADKIADNLYSKEESK